MKRRYDLRKVKPGWTYTVKEICDTFGLHPRTVQLWIARESLEPIEGSRNPYLIAGLTLLSFLKRRSEKYKCHLGIDEFYCVRCRAVHKSRPENLQDIKTKIKLGHDKFAGRKIGICEECGSRLNRFYAFYMDGP